MRPNTMTSNERLYYWIIVLLRALFFIISLIALSQIAELGTSTFILSIAAISGCISSSYLAFSRLKNFGFLLLGIGLYLLYNAAFRIVGLIFEPLLPRIFDAYDIQLHTDLFLLTFIISAATTWFFWRIQAWLSLEISAAIACSIYILAGHRNYRFDSVRIINTLSWTFNIDELLLLVLIGASLCFLLCVYFYIATLPSRPSAISSTPSRAYSSSQKVTHWILPATLMLLILGVISNLVYRHNIIEAGSKLSNGVGEGVGQGLSPLGFHSALGATNQPSALVRLDTDYPVNPYSPLLYFREQALSEFNGHELVVADSAFDQDTTGNSPEQPYNRDETDDKSLRTPLKQSMYLLTEHKLAFAVDYPLSIAPIRNPNPGRFKATFQAYSMAPAFSMSDLESDTVGDPSWSIGYKSHYLSVHQDPRYSELAHKITAGIKSQIKMATALTQYLSDNAIYTLTPNHAVQPQDDQVAPFLFGDMRGYCVHFAHALVYMMRSLGIPSRIGTGYLTDLSQSKDGHILLRMSDRHAWSEVYITGKGWVPFDVQPRQVENHAETPVDMQLLEELMGTLDPGEETLPKDLTKNEPSFGDSRSIWDILLPYRTALLITLLTLIVTPLTIKVYLRYAWLLPADPAQKLVRSYLASLSTLYDLGLRRNEGETRLEFQKRMHSFFEKDILNLTPQLNRIRFEANSAIDIGESDIIASRKADIETISTITFYKRFIAFINPASVTTLVLGGRW